MKVWKLVIVLLAVGMFSVSAVAQGLTCPTATAVAVPSNTAGDTLAGGGGGGPFRDCLHEYGGPGGWAVGAQWYSFVGTGNTVTVSLCVTELVDTDAAMVVVCQSCACPMCVGASEDFCGASGYNPEVTFCTAAGETYWVGVGDNYTPQGTFTLDVSDDATACGAPPTCFETCGNNVWEGCEECDGTDNGACEVSCEGDCTCTPVVCGNNIAFGDEECDGTDNGACEVSCEGDCTCTPVVCGNNIVFGDEECDGTDIGVCVPGTICDGDCTCPDPICDNNIKEEGEDCDGTDDDACPSLCEMPGCTCPAAPALPIWGIVGLGVLLAGGGATAVARRRKKA